MIEKGEKERESSERELGESEDYIYTVVCHKYSALAHSLFLSN